MVITMELREDVLVGGRSIVSASEINQSWLCTIIASCDQDFDTRQPRDYVNIDILITDTFFL